MSDGTQDRVRARDLGVPFDGTPGPHNAITDVPGVEVGMVTILDPDEATRKACTGVPAILPRGRDGVGDPCAAGIYSLNGNGEMTGRSWIEESGALALPIAITNSHAVGAVHTGVDQWVAKVHPEVGVQWMLPTVAETWDGYLNDINGGHVRPEHAHQALDGATSGPVQEGCVGGGTGMNCYGFKGGTGTASRVVWVDTATSWTADAALCPACGSLLTVADGRWDCPGCDLTLAQHVRRAQQPRHQRLRRQRAGLAPAPPVATSPATSSSPSPRATRGR